MKFASTKIYPYILLVWSVNFACSITHCAAHLMYFSLGIFEYIRRPKNWRTNFLIYSFLTCWPNIYEYEYICEKIFEYIRISEYSLYTAVELSFYLIGWGHRFIGRGTYIKKNQTSKSKYLCREGRPCQGKGLAAYITVAKERNIIV